jgi:hypothetical protein
MHSHFFYLFPCFFLYIFDIFFQQSQWLSRSYPIFPCHPNFFWRVFFSLLQQTSTLKTSTTEPFKARKSKLQHTNMRSWLIKELIFSSNRCLTLYSSRSRQPHMPCRCIKCCVRSACLNSNKDHVRNPC